MAMNISCKFDKASCNIFFVRAVTVKSLYTLRRNEVKSIVSTGCCNTKILPQTALKCIEYLQSFMSLLLKHAILRKLLKVMYVCNHSQQNDS